MNRRAVLHSLLASAAVCCVPWGAACAAPGIMRRLNMTTRYDVKHKMVQHVLLPWADTLRDRSHGRLKIHIASPDVLCPDVDVFNALLVDTVSIGCISPTALVPPLPVSTLFDYPALFPNAEVGSQVLWEVFQESEALQREFRLVHVLWTWISAPMYLHTIKKPICTLRDVKGLKLVVWSSLDGLMLQAMGALPVQSTPVNTAKLLRMGLADGVVCPLPPMSSFGITALLNYTLDIPLNSVSFFLAMNREVWTALPPEHRTLLNEMSGKRMAMLCGKNLDDTAKASRAGMLAEGHTFLSSCSEDTVQWQRPMHDLGSAWEDKLVEMKLLESKGLLKTILEASARIEREQAR